MTIWLAGNLFFGNPVGCGGRWWLTGALDIGNSNFQRKDFIKKKKIFTIRTDELVQAEASPPRPASTSWTFKIIIELFMLIPVMSFLLKQFVHLHSTKLLKTKAQFSQQLYDLSSSDSRERMSYSATAALNPLKTVFERLFLATIINTTRRLNPHMSVDNNNIIRNR